jgi:hypothetical protein
MAQNLTSIAIVRPDLNRSSGQIDLSCHVEFTNPIESTQVGSFQKHKRAPYCHSLARRVLTQPQYARRNHLLTPVKNVVSQVSILMVGSDFDIHQSRELHACVIYTRGKLVSK